MKSNYLSKIVSVIALLSFSFFISCSNDDDRSGNQEKTIAALASSKPELSILVQALDKAGLVSVLNSTTEFTVFAPTNAAFTEFLQANGFANLNEVPVDALKEILLNHVVNGELEADDLSTGYVKTLAKGSASATNTLSLFVNTANGVVLNGGASNNGATVTQADLDASNGVIHIVDHVIALPTIVNHAIANPNFEILVQALTRNDQPDFAGILSGTNSSPFTVFAPTNQAFGDLLTELNLTNLSQVPQTTLENTLKYHVVTSINALSTSLTNGMNVTTFQGSNFTINTGNTVTITDANNRVSTVIATDVQASNGVIHAINKVILPNL